jgi:SAM-dependent methyltransferase
MEPNFVNISKENILESSIIVEGIPYPIYDGGLRFFEQTRRIGNWPIDKTTQNIVDVGCGHTPFPYANILIDKNISDCKERFGFAIPNDCRTIIEADVEIQLPLSNKEVDFLYCSHTLEHCEEPIRALKEIMRVAKAGFIETPNIVYELLFGGNESLHKWVTECDERENKLVFRKLSSTEKKAIIRREQLGDYPWKLFADPIKKHRLHHTAYWQNQELFTNCFLWQNSFNIEIIE